MIRDALPPDARSGGRRRGPAVAPGAIVTRWRRGPFVGSWAMIDQARPPRSSARASRKVRLRPLVQPREHGVYGLYAEPVLLGLLLAPSLAGVSIAVAAAAAVIAQQPAALALADLRRGRSYPRTRAAGSIALVLTLVAVFALIAATNGAGTAASNGLASAWWLPLGVALVPAGVQFAADRRLQGSTLLAQVSGALALASLVAAIALAGGASVAVAWTAWAGLALRVVVSIPTVRARLRWARGRPAARLPVRIASLVLPLGALAGWTFGLMSLVPLAVAVVLAARTLWTARADAPAVPASHVGIAEIVLGVIWVAALAVGLRS